MYLLDTNVCIHLLNGDHPQITGHLASLKPKVIRLCTIVQQELYFGAYRSTKVQQNLDKLKRFLELFTVLDFDESAARIAGEIQAELRKQGSPIGAYDIQIAAVALANNLIVVTHNVREFQRIKNLRYEDWEI